MAFFPANFMSQTAPHEDEHPHQHHPPPPLTQILYSCTPQDYHGNPSVYLVSVMFGMMKRKYSDKDPPMLSSVASLISLASFVCWGYPLTCCCVALSLLLGMAPFLGKRSMSFSGVEVSTEEVPKPNTGEEDLSDDGLQPGEKKRRLSIEQVKTLEKNFELCKKLEPERKMQLAQALRLQPRQIAIWFQNRRARWKTKQLEKDYDLLKRQFEAIKSDNEALRAQNQKLQAEIQALKSGEPAESINLNKETEGSSSNRSENSSEFKLDTSMTRTPRAIENHQLFPASSSLCSASGGGTGGGGGGGGIPHQLLHSSSSSSRPYPAVKEETYTNMFGGIDDQSRFWPWLEQQHFN